MNIHRLLLDYHMIYSVVIIINILLHMPFLHHVLIVVSKNSIFFFTNNQKIDLIIPLTIVFILIIAIAEYNNN